MKTLPPVGSTVSMAYASMVAIGLATIALYIAFRVRRRFSPQAALLPCGISHILIAMTPETPMEPPVFTPATAKIVEAVLYLIEEAKKLGHELTQYDIVKTFWIADKDHLDEYGRPVSYDNYVAMEHGPVGSMTYDLLKPAFDWSQLGEARAPWQRIAQPGSNTAFYRSPVRPANIRKMSGSDRRALVKAMLFVKREGFERIRNRTHGSWAYRSAWKDDGGKSFPMDPRLIPSERDDERMADLAYASSHLA